MTLSHLPISVLIPFFLLLFIVNPLSGASVSKLFSTHPATEERVRRLESMAPGTRARM